MAEFIDSGLRYSTPLTINSRQRAFRSETVNLKIQTNVSDAQRWDILLTLEPSANRDITPAGAALSVHRSTRGTSSSFEVEMPQHIGIVSTSRNVTVKTGAPGGSDQIPVTTDGNDTKIQAGQFITFGAHKKVYQVTGALMGFGPADTVFLEIFPPLVSPVVPGDSINFDPNIAVFYDQDGIDGVTYSGGRVVSAKVSLVEALI